ncbi:MAG: trigger factor [Patescibacteria group bacterium]
MKINIKKLPKSEVEIEGELGADLFEDFFTRALKRLGENLKIDGFRKGKIPEHILLAKIPEMTILEEMAQVALNEHYPKILEAEKIDAIGQPMISITKLARKNPLGFKIKTAELGEIKLPDYKNIAREINSKVTPEEKTRLKIIEKIIEGSELEIPEILLEVELNKIIYRMESDITGMGLKFEDYLKQLSKTKEDLKKDFRVDAEKGAKLALILNEIAKVEAIVADEEQVLKEVAQILKQHKNADREGARMHAEQVLTNEKIFVFLENC